MHLVDGNNQGEQKADSNSYNLHVADLGVK